MSNNWVFHNGIPVEVSPNTGADVSYNSSTNEIGWLLQEDETEE